MAEVDNIINEPSEAEKRIKSLSGKVADTALERDTEKARADSAETAKAEAERRAEFAEGFTDVVANNPAAKEFKTDIQAKVMSGYSIEDATFAVLGKAGKLNQPVATETMSPAGGSASTSLPQNGSNKTIAEMDQAERRKALEDILIVT